MDSSEIPYWDPSVAVIMAQVGVSLLCTITNALSCNPGLEPGKLQPLFANNYSSHCVILWAELKTSSGGLVVKNPSASAEDPREVGWIPGLGRSSRIRNGTPLHLFLSGKFHGQRSPWAAAYGAAKNWTRLSNWTHTYTKHPHTWPSPTKPTLSGMTPHITCFHGQWTAGWHHTVASARSILKAPPGPRFPRMQTSESPHEALLTQLMVRRKHHLLFKRKGGTQQLTVAVPKDQLFACLLWSLLLFLVRLRNQETQSRFSGTFLQLAAHGVGESLFSVLMPVKLGSQRQVRQSESRSTLLPHRRSMNCKSLYTPQSH